MLINFEQDINDLEMLIAGSEPDLILITEILPKHHSYFINKASLMIHGYSLYQEYIIYIFRESV